MAEEAENIVHAMLHEIRATQLEQSASLRALEDRSQRVEKQLEDLRAQLRQMKQGATFDDLFSELERILANEKPK
jgi:DNA-binding transcriptional MerR regulator